jgi:methylglyoxal synthase
LRIALVSHDAKKAALTEWAAAWQEALSQHLLCGTGTTATEVMRACPGLTVEELLSGPKGGDLQVGARIATRQLDALVFFVDPESPHPHENDVQALIRISLLADIPVALNRSSADHLAEAMFLVRGQG